MVEITSQIAPLNYQRYPIYVQISFWKSDDHYSVRIQYDGSPFYEFAVPITPHELSTLNKDMQEAIGNASISKNPENQLQQLAELGNAAYKTIFRDENARKTIESALRQVPEKGIIQITSNEFILPWDLIYDQDVTNNVTFEKFWGMRFIVYRVPVLRNRAGDFVSQELHSCCPKVGLYANTDLRSVVSKEIPFFEQLKSERKIDLSLLRPLDPNNRIEELRYFVDTWKKDINIAHLACHAKSDLSPMRSCIILSDKFQITVQDMAVYELKINNTPLVILNGCKTGNLDPLYVASIASCFIEKGARGVIATEYSVSDDLAAEVTKAIYDQLLQECPLGESLIETRRKLLLDFHSPIGLVYALYAPPNFKIIRN